MSYVAIIYYPENEKRSSGLPFGMRGDRQFWYTLNAPSPQGKATTKKSEEAATSLTENYRNTIKPIELDAVTLKKGTNFINAEAWKLASSESQNIADINRLLKISALRIYTPDNPEVAGKDSSDFADVSVVDELVNNSSDSDWLTLCLNVDRRIEVRQIIDLRLKDIREEEAARMQRIRGLVNT